jgi:hypothetical protein
MLLMLESQLQYLNQPFEGWEWPRKLENMKDDGWKTHR